MSSLIWLLTEVTATRSFVKTEANAVFVRKNAAKTRYFILDLIAGFKYINKHFRIVKTRGKGLFFSPAHLLILFALFAAVFLSGCATNPVSGRKQLMFLSESGEVQLDRENSPHQISADYGVVQDADLNRYVSAVGGQLTEVSHRPDMPYNFNVVNAVYINAYAFPGGTIAVSRGMLVEMDSEAELAAVLGHEIGHVCSRHTAQQYTIGMLGSAAVSVAALVVKQKNSEYAGLVSGLGSMASGALLARYSRADEREADALSLEYMTKARYNPQGCINVMDILRKVSTNEPSAVEMLFATHPMSEERYATAVREVAEKYRACTNYPVNRERFHEKTVRLMAIKGAILKMREGEKAIAENNLDAAESALREALREAPRDYAGLMLMAKCQLARKNAVEAEKYARQAHEVYPEEPQAMHLLGMSKTQQQKYDEAYVAFSEYEKMLPGNPNTVFFKGYALEGMGRRNEAAQQYMRYMNSVQQGDYYNHAYQSLSGWGYMRQSPQRQRYR